MWEGAWNLVGRVQKQYGMVGRPIPHTTGVPPPPYPATRGNPGTLVRELNLFVFGGILGPFGPFRPFETVPVCCFLKFFYLFLLCVL